MPTETAEKQSELSRRIFAFVQEHGKLYAPVPHPDFAALPYSNGPERFDLIAPHLGHRGGTALDIGAHWGYISHRLEDMGYKVTAVEHGQNNGYFLKGIRDLCGKNFEVVIGSAFELPKPDYDVVFALNVFHHYLKDQRRFNVLEEFLGRLKCREMIYQGHSETERQMVGAELPMKADDMARHLAKRLQLPNVEEIGAIRKRKIFKLS